MAGSEKVSNHNNLGEVLKDNNMPVEMAVGKLKEERVREGKFINKSLFFLTQVISMRGEGKKDHIPYRNSPLTKILKSSLGGNSRTVILLCATPMHSQYEQTLSTIRFGVSAKKIENTIYANVSSHKSEEAYQLMINEYENRLKEMEELRTNDSKRSEYMTKMIADLQKQKELLNERLKKANEEKLLLNSQKLTEKIIEEKIPARKEFHKENVGILYTNAKIKYVLELQERPKGSVLDSDRNGKIALAALKKQLVINKSLKGEISSMAEMLKMLVRENQEERNKNICFQEKMAHCLKIIVI